MRIIFHVSDLHFTTDSAATHRVVLASMLEDIKKKYGGIRADKYFLISGDLVKEGSDNKAFDELSAFISTSFPGIGILPSGIVCTPGNHDLSRDDLKVEINEHEGLIQQCEKEDEFIRFFRGKEIFSRKFEKYIAFEKNINALGVGESALGQGHEISGKVGIYCMNSAYFSSGGLQGLKGPIKDKGRLVIDTKDLHQWIQEKNFETRILVMHHPLDWLTEWSANELRALLGKKIQIFITGHVHDQDAYDRANAVGRYIHLMSPALYTDKQESLGYAAIFFDEEDNPDRVEFRQWVPKTQVFVSGSVFSSTDDGCVSIRSQTKEFTSHKITEAGNNNQGIRAFNDSSIGKTLKSRLDAALKCFTGKSVIFVDPILSNLSEVNSNKNKNQTISIEEIIDNKFPAVIHAPPQFGLTCAARSFCLKAWEHKGQVWLFVDALTTKPHRQSIVAAIQTELEALDVTIDKVEGIVVDSIRNSDKETKKLAEKLTDLYKGMNFLFMHSNDLPGGEDLPAENLGKMTHYFLWSMSRSSIRKVVSDYNDIRHIGDEDVVTSRLATDLEIMNIHRTPLNCLTILKAIEFQHEDSPVNRAELIKRVLNVLFNQGEVPNYKSRPDVKDCEYILGFFCERIVRSGNSRFTRDYFRKTLRDFCDKNLIDIDVDWVFDVLHENNIIVARGYEFEFKFLYWIMYFSAQRMYQDQDFRDYVFQDERYSTYPEMIEFYTGTNRSMSDAIEILSKDLSNLIKEFDKKIALPEDFDIFSIAQWKPSSDVIEQMREDTSRGVEKSNLPASVKDQYADRTYDRAKPYGQEIRSALSGFSYNKMLQSMRAASKALRNSDYVDTELKKNILSEIISVWERAATVILLLVPALAKNGEAVFDDVYYVLDGEFPTEIDDRFLSVLQEIPSNISNYYENDLFSRKMGPLLSSHMNGNSSNIAKHFLALLILKNRPRNWNETLRKYILNLPKNSFYLLDIYRGLRREYSYGYVSNSSLDEIARLIQFCAAKHLTGAKDLGERKVKAIVAKIDGEPIVPERMVDSGESAS